MPFAARASRMPACCRTGAPHCSFARAARARCSPSISFEPADGHGRGGRARVLTEPGFVRALARALQGMVLVGVASRRNDRLLRLTFAARSRFGVGDSLDLYLELVPRFGNVVLVKDATVVAASKEFSPSETAAPRASRVPYFPPPLPQNPRRSTRSPRIGAGALRVAKAGGSWPTAATSASRCGGARCSNAWRARAQAARRARIARREAPARGKARRTARARRGRLCDASRAAGFRA